jgi:hypothetical protein
LGAVLPCEQGVYASVEPGDALFNHPKGDLHDVHAPLQIPELPALLRKRGLGYVLQKPLQRCASPVRTPQQKLLQL